MKKISGNFIKKLLGTLVLFGLFVVPFSVSAFEFHSSQNYTLGEGQSINEDLYVGAGRADLSGIVNGDVFLAGEQIDISGTSSEDIMAAASVVNFSGSATDDVRFAGDRINFSGKASSSVLVLGQDIHFTPASEVVGETFIYGANITLAGNFRSDVELRGGGIAVSGRIDGDLESDAASVVIEPDAVITGDVRYIGKNPPQISDEAEIAGEVVSVGSAATAPENTPFVSGVVILGFLMVGLGAFLFGLLLRKTGVNGTAKLFSSDAWRYVLLGFFVFLSLPFLSAMLLATIIGIPLAILVFLLYLAWLLLAWFFAPIFIGSMLWKWLQKNEAFEVTWQSILLGVFAFTAFVFIPFFGWILQLFFVMASAGVILALFFRGLDKQR